eukprot:10427850-Lingulodinium_polyedra.AAC.1
MRPNPSGARHVPGASTSTSGTGARRGPTWQSLPAGGTARRSEYCRWATRSATASGSACSMPRCAAASA